MDEKLFNIIITLIPVVCAIITYYFVPYIKAVIGNEKLNQYKEWTELAVKCAEMIFNEKGMGKDKKKFVIEFLTEKFNKNKTDITEEQLNILIEAAVQELNKKKK